MASWGTGLSLRGAKGDAGTGVLTSNGAPTAAGVEGQAAVDTTNGTLYKYTNGAWVAGKNLVGPMGLNGINGSFYAGINVPDSSTYSGNGAAIYIRANGEVYLYQGNGTWQDTGENLTGPQGISGNAGSRGTQVYTGHGSPSANLSSFTPAAMPGDIYFDLDSGPSLFVLS